MTGADIQALYNQAERQGNYLRNIRNWVRFIGWFFVVIPMAWVIIKIVGALALFSTLLNNF